MAECENSEGQIIAVGPQDGVGQPHGWYHPTRTCALVLYLTGSDPWYYAKDTGKDRWKNNTSRCGACGRWINRGAPR